jgi:hypothetical protein
VWQHAIFWDTQLKKVRESFAEAYHLVSHSILRVLSLVLEHSFICHAVRAIATSKSKPLIPKISLLSWDCNSTLAVFSACNLVKLIEIHIEVSKTTVRYSERGFPTFLNSCCLKQSFPVSPPSCSHASLHSRIFPCQIARRMSISISWENCTL